jgi:hypothetical protein
MTGLIRYAALDWLRSQRWASPTLIMLITVVVFYASFSGVALGAFAVTSTLLFPLTAWLVVTALNVEPPEQRAIITVAAGGIGKVLTARVFVASGWAVLLAFLSLGWSLLLTNITGGMDLVAGVVAHLLCVLGGAALGMALARPIVEKPGFVALWVLGVFMVEIAVPVVPPVGPLVRMLTGDNPPTAGGLAVVTLMTVVFAGVLGTFAVRIIRRHG